LTSAATLYATRRLDLGVLRVAFRGTRVLEGAGGQWAELERDGCRLTLTQLEDADAADHVAGVRTFVSERGEVLDPSFLTAVAAVVQVIRLNATTPTTTEPVRGWLAQLLALAAGFWFDGTTFRDPGGRALAASVVPVSRARSPSGASAAPVIDDDGDGTTDVGSAGTGRFTEPPDALRVLHRAWALCALASRARLEGLPAAMAGARAATIVGWMRSRGVEAELEPDERELLEAAPGELARDARVDASWRGDGAGVLAWALGVTPQPDYQVATDLDTMTLPLRDRGARRAPRPGPALRRTRDRPPRRTPGRRPRSSRWSSTEGRRGGVLGVGYPEHLGGGGGDLDHRWSRPRSWCSAAARRHHGRPGQPRHRPAAHPPFRHPSSSGAGSPRCCAARRSPRWPSPSPAAAATSRASAPAPCATATTTSSTAPRPSSPRAAAPTSSPSRSAPAAPATAASRCSSSSAGPRASR
jgi:hypothetical protein